MDNYFRTANTAGMKQNNNIFVTSRISTLLEPSRQLVSNPVSLLSMAKLTAKESSHSILEFNAFNARLFKKRLAPRLAEFFPSTVGLSLEFVAVKKFGKELGTENHNSNRRNHNVCIYSFV